MAFMAPMVWEGTSKARRGDYNLGMTIKIAAFSGSLRADSFNRKLVTRAAQVVRDAGAEVELLDLRDYDAPLFNEDLEAAEGMPESVKAFKAVVAGCHGLLISTPEYNHSISSALKNIIDWGSRANSADDPAPCFPGTTAAVMSCSPGGLGGIRCLDHLRAILHNTGIRVIHEQYAMPGAHKAFAEDGSLIDERIDGQVLDIGTQLVRITSLLNPDA